MSEAKKSLKAGDPGVISIPAGCRQEAVALRTADEPDYLSFVVTEEAKRDPDWRAKARDCRGAIDPAP